MRLIDLAEPLFQYICMIRRLGENSVEYSYDKARSDINKIFNEIEYKASQDRMLGLQYSKMKLPLIFFTDSMIAESKISFAAEWDDNRLAYEHSEMTGDHKFFEILEEIFEDRLNSQEECLYVFYVCIGLGFKGIYKPKTKQKQLQQIMWKICDHLPDVLKKEPDFLLEQDIDINRSALKIPFFISFWKPRTFIIIVAVLLGVWIFSNIFLYLGASYKANAAFKDVKVEKLNLENQ